MHGSLTLLGSTGSVGRQALETAGHLGFRIMALSAGSNISLLEEQVRRFKPAIAAVADEKAYKDFRARVRDVDVRVTAGTQGLAEAACVDGAETVLVAVTGAAGLTPTLDAVKLGRRIALANKETLVCAGEIVMEEARLHAARVIPVDSEHSAIFQCLRDESPENVKRLILTASGGAFAGMGRDELSKVTPEMALRHPTWEMGRKITIDSATLMNKGFEVIEAMHLFSAPLEKISVVIHPQSVIHSMVEFVDNSVAAQLAFPDMRLPIQYALTYPQRAPSLINELDFGKLSNLTFAQPDYEAFPCLNLAIEAAKRKGTAGAILNGADEAAVDAFLAGKLSFYGIYDAVNEALGTIKITANPTSEDIICAGEEARQFVRSFTSRLRQ